MAMKRRMVRIFACAMMLMIAGCSMVPVQAEGNWTNILLMGGDSRDYSAYGRTDSMIVLSINESTSEVKMTSLMRDTWVNISGHGWAKLNAANVYGGPSLTMQTIESCYDIDLDHYVLVNMMGLATIIDIAGGVDVAVSSKEVTVINNYLENRSEEASSASKLTQSGDSVHLTGDQAMALCQNRMLDSDYYRTERQRRVLVALAKQLKNNDAVKLIEILTKMMEYVETDLSMLDIAKLMAIALKVDMENVEELRLPADGTFESGMKNGTWSIRPNFEKNAAIFAEFLGE